MLGFKEELSEIIKKGKCINVGVVGAGQMGLSIISLLNTIPGFRVLAVADKDFSGLEFISKNLEMPRDMFFLVKNPGTGSIFREDLDSLIKGKSIPGFNFFEKTSNEINKGKIIFTDDFNALARIPEIDVVVDATGYTEIGAAVSLVSILNGKDVVTLNVETDITVGPILNKMARERNLVYTLSAGDEPAALKELYDFCEGLGFEVICAGKGKNNPLDKEANPSTLAAYAAKKGSSPRMMTSFVDGTKSMIEMACLSNATGLIPDRRGMHGPKANIAQLLQIFNTKKLGGVLENTKVVDFVIGDLAPGVFIIFTTFNKLVKDLLNYLLLGEGPNYLLYRPYHIPGVETPLSIVRAFLHRKPWIVPLKGLVSDVVTVAKKDLAKGEKIDGIGGYMVYGLIEKYNISSAENLLPIGLCQGCILKKNIKAGQAISLDDVECDDGTLLMQLRELQTESIQSLKIVE